MESFNSSAKNEPELISKTDQSEVTAPKEISLKPWNHEDFQFEDYLEELHFYFEEEFLNFVGGIELLKDTSSGIIALSAGDIPLDVIFETKKGSKVQRTKDGLRYLPKAFETHNRNTFLTLRNLSHNFVKAYYEDDLGFLETLATEMGTIQLVSDLKSFDLRNEGDLLEFGPCLVNETAQTYQVTQQFYIRTNPSTYYSFPITRKSFKFLLSFIKDSLLIEKSELKDLGKSNSFHNLKYVIRYQSPRHIHSKSSFSMKKGEKIIFFIMKPPELPQIRNVVMSAYVEPSKKPVELQTYFQNGFGETILSVTLEADSNDTQLVIDSEFDFYQRLIDLKRWNEPYEPYPITPEERAHYLQKDDSKYNWDKPSFQDWLEQNNLFWKKNEENEIEFGYRALKRIHEQMEYSAEDALRGCGSGGVAKGILEGRTDCGGLSLLLSAVMRANGIPGRLMQGQACDFVPLSDYIRNLGIRRDEWGLSFHAMSEFYVEGCGWVPVESTDRRLFTFGKDSKSHPFLVRHFDFVYNLEVTVKETKKTLHPFFMSVIYPFVLEGGTKNLVYEYKRQKWFVEELDFHTGKKKNRYENEYD